MTTTVTVTPPDLADSIGAVRTVRSIVRADGVLCLVLGGLLFAGTAPLADVAGLEPRWPVGAVGAFLVLLGANLLVLARVSPRHLLAITPWSADSDFLWAIASVAVAFGVSLTGPGRAMVLALGLAAVPIGIAKVRAVRAAG